MTPLKVFNKYLLNFQQKPYHFWDSSIQENFLREVKIAIDKLLSDLTKKKLQKTKAYQVLSGMQINLKSLDDKEDEFLKNLTLLLEVYRQAPAEHNLEKSLDDLEKNLSRAKKIVLEYQAQMDDLKEESEKLSDEQKQKKDLETLQKVGIFYVLEYTLQVYFEFQRLSDEDKWKLLKEGLVVEAGNLPAYYPLHDSMRKELCHQVFDEKLRDSLMLAFYKFDDVVYSEDMNQFQEGLRVFNLSLLTVFNDYGLIEYKAQIYAPYGNNIPIADIINHLKK